MNFSNLFYFKNQLFDNLMIHLLVIKTFLSMGKHTSENAVVQKARARAPSTENEGRKPFNGW